MPGDGYLRGGGAALIALLLGACVGAPPRPAALATGPALELAATPFFPQRDHQCGPAALAMVAAAYGIAITPDELTPRLVIPARAGSLQIELEAQARALGLLAHRLEGGFEGLVGELAAGHPVIVLQNNGLSWLPVWHYAVAIGYDPAADVVVLRSGVTAHHVLGRATFERTWARAARWGLVALPPGDVPARASDATYALSAAAFEGQASRPAARAAWDAAVQRWPEAWAPAFALGNLDYADGDYAAASRRFARAVALDPRQGAAWNNLAGAYLAAGRWDEAEAAAREAVRLGGPQLTQFEATLREVLARRPR
jgi:tetratricopeptide (TPR) repeat protein